MVGPGRGFTGARALNGGGGATTMVGPGRGFTGARAHSG